ncbi:unnamed protein product [Cylindrotheca closterium]|uniref:Uncharacterized protein n=1 Tax=Cylindrotheca closterium TaxID=2856 RepID=A0AAD2PW26_9STRA|nr:unnamed protein product [Cylindrotheca closterium]
MEAMDLVPGSIGTTAVLAACTANAPAGIGTTGVTTAVAATSIFEVPNFHQLLENFEVVVSALKAEEGTMKTTDGDLRAEMADMKTINSNLGAEIADMKTTISNLKAEVITMETTDANLGVEMADMKSANSNLGAEIEELKAANETQKYEIQILKADLHQARLDVLAKHTKDIGICRGRIVAPACATYFETSKSMAVVS